MALEGNLSEGIPSLSSSGSEELLLAKSCQTQPLAEYPGRPKQWKIKFEVHTMQQQQQQGRLRAQELDALEIFKATMAQRPHAVKSIHVLSSGWCVYLCKNLC